MTMRPGEIATTFVGNLTADPELRFTPNGLAVAQFTVAVNPRRYNRETGQWEDEPPTFVRCQAWRQLAENVAGSLQRGDRVIVAGRLREERWEDRETGQQRSTWRLTVDAMGPDLTNATAKVERIKREAVTAPQDDPWATSVPAPTVPDEPPF
jgi:single-strand DNA-binding protein